MASQPSGYRIGAGFAAPLVLVAVAAVAAARDPAGFAAPLVLVAVAAVAAGTEG